MNETLRIRPRLRSWRKARLLMTALLALAACRPNPRAESRKHAQEIWHEHEAAVVHAIDGHQENDEFVDAVDFFARVTGIEIHINIFTLGYLPTAETPADLELIRKWYAEHKDDLYFDSATQAVQVRSD